MALGEGRFETRLRIRNSWMVLDISSCFVNLRQAGRIVLQESPWSCEEAHSDFPQKGSVKNVRCSEAFAFFGKPVGNGSISLPRLGGAKAVLDSKVREAREVKARPWLTERLGEKKGSK